MISLDQAREIMGGTAMSVDTVTPSGARTDERQR